jgi:hypothetical protein
MSQGVTFRERQEALVSQIRLLAEQEGMKAAEIAACLGIRVRRVWRIAASQGIQMAEAGGRRRVSAYLTRRCVDPLELVARRAGISRSATVSRLLSIVLADADGRTAIRLLGKKGLPKRRYQARKVRTREKQEPHDVGDR